MSRAVFLDRDGVINEMVPSPEGPDSPRSVDEFHLLPKAAAGVRSLNELGLPVVVVSNQPGVAKGKFPIADLQAMTERLEEALRDDLAAVQGIYYCLHHPQAVVDDYRKVCDCRKPKPGLLVQAAKDMQLELNGSYMVGDQGRDMTAGKSVGCTTLFVGASLPHQKPDDADHVCRDLEAAAHLIAQLESPDRRLDDPSIRRATKPGKPMKPVSALPTTSGASGRSTTSTYSGKP